MLPRLVLWQSTSFDSDPEHFRSSNRMFKPSLPPNDATLAPEDEGGGREGLGGVKGEEEEGKKEGWGRKEG